MITRYEEQMYNDIHRIANALEKIAKILSEPSDIDVKKINQVKNIQLSTEGQHRGHTVVMTKGE